MARIIIAVGNLEKHRRTQLVVTLLTCVGAGVGLMIPDWSHLSIFAGVITNLVWVWE